MPSWRLTKIAAADLVEILSQGIEQFGKSQARRYADSLENTFAMLVSVPLVGREHTHTTEPVRVHFHQSHVIVYVLAGADIVIIRLLPSRREWKEYL